MLVKTGLRNATGRDCRPFPISYKLFLNMNDQFTAYKHRMLVQIRFKDFDMMGHVNNANYFTYVESARLNYFDHVLGKDTDWHSQHGLILAHFSIDFKQAIGYDDRVYVYTRCSRLGTKSFDLNWIITKDTTALPEPEIVAQGKAVIACYDYQLKQSKVIPAERRRLIQDFEGLPLDE